MKTIQPIDVSAGQRSVHQMCRGTEANVRRKRGDNDQDKRARQA